MNAITSDRWVLPHVARCTLPGQRLETRAQIKRLQHIVPGQSAVAENTRPSPLSALALWPKNVVAINARPEMVECIIYAHNSSPHSNAQSLVGLPTRAPFPLSTPSLCSLLWQQLTQHCRLIKAIYRIRDTGFYSGCPERRKSTKRK